MEVNTTSFQFKDLLGKAKKILILIGEPKTDLVAGGIALNQILKSQGKLVDLVSLKTLTQATSVFAGVEDIKSDIESRNIIISLDYEKNPIDKISYKMEGKNFNLIIKPKKDISLDDIQTSFSGGDYNLIIILGTKNLAETSLYLKNRDLFESLPTVNVDTNESNVRFGKLNIVDPKIKSVSAMISLLLNDAGIKLTEKSANLLLLGMRDATQNFSNINGPKIFEAAAYTAKSKEMTGDSEKRSYEDNINKNLPKEWLSPKVYRSSKVS